MLIVFVRTIVLYFAVVLSVRIMGKRQLGELQPSELVVAMIVSNIASLPIEDTDIPLAAGVMPILVLVSFEVLISSIALKLPFLRRIFSGSTKVIIENGVINQNEMKNLRFSIDDLYEELHAQGIFDLSEVYLAIVETTGKVNFYQRFQAQPATAGMMQIKGSDTLPPSVIIKDRQWSQTALDQCQKTKEWAIRKIKERGLSGPDDVFLMTADQSGKVFLVPKDRGKRRKKAR